MDRMKNVIIAPVGDNMEALFIGLKDFPTERVYLLAPKNRRREAEEARKDLEKFRIPVKVYDISGNIWEEMFKKIGEISALEKDTHILVNTATGDRMTTCAATSAAFVNGIKAFSVEGDEAMLLPVLKFSYYRILTDKKMHILKLLARPDCCMSLEELSKKSKMSLPLVSYHINGNLKSEGLKDMGLVETEEKKGRIALRLTTLGKMLISGYVV